MRERVFKWGLLHLFFISLALSIRIYQPDFSYLNWNMFLALVSLDAAYLLVVSKRAWVRILSGLIWFFFYPNTFYMVTDLVHMAPWLKDALSHQEHLIWFMLFTASSSFGVLAGIESAAQIFQTLKIKTWYWRWLLILALSFVSSLAIHVGRYARFNSWDVLTRPFAAVEELLKSLSAENAVFLTAFTFLQVMALIFMDRPPKG